MGVFGEDDWWMEADEESTFLVVGIHVGIVGGGMIGEIE